MGRLGRKDPWKTCPPPEIPEGEDMEDKAEAPEDLPEVLRILQGHRHGRSDPQEEEAQEGAGADGRLLQL